MKNDFTLIKNCMKATTLGIEEIYGTIFFFFFYQINSIWNVSYI
jgi:hypothetical protein